MARARDLACAVLLAELEAGTVSEEELPACAKRKEEIRDHILSLPPDLQIVAIKKGLDDKTQLGKFIQLQRGLFRASFMSGILFDLVKAYLPVARKEDAPFSGRIVATLIMGMNKKNNISDEILIYIIKLLIHNAQRTIENGIEPKIPIKKYSIIQQKVLDAKSLEVTEAYLSLLATRLKYHPGTFTSILTLLDLVFKNGHTLTDLVIHFGRKGNTKIVNTFVWLLINCLRDHNSFIQIDKILNKVSVPFGWFDSKTTLLIQLRLELKPMPQTIYMLWRYGFLATRDYDLSDADKQKVLDYIRTRLPAEEKRDALAYASASGLLPQPTTVSTTPLPTSLPEADVQSQPLTFVSLDTLTASISQSSISVQNSDQMIYATLGFIPTISTPEAAPLTAASTTTMASTYSLQPNPHLLTALYAELTALSPPTHEVLQPTFVRSEELTRQKIAL